MKKRIELNENDRIANYLMSGIFDEEIDDGSMTPAFMIEQACNRYWKPADGYSHLIPWWFGIACAARKFGLSVHVRVDDHRFEYWKSYAINLEGSEYPIALYARVQDDGPEALNVVMHEIERLIAHPDEIVPVNDDGGADDDDWIGIDGEGPVASMMHEMRRSHERVVDRIRLLNPAQS